MKQFLGKSPSGLFATQTLAGHVIRGAVAFALLYLAIGTQHLHPVASLLAGLLALVSMRGCPVCWTIGLVETIRQRYGEVESRGLPRSALLRRVRHGLEQFHRIAGRVLEQDLPATRSGDDVVSKLDTGSPQGFDIAVKVAASHNDPIPAPRLRSAAIGHWLRSPAWSFGRTQHELKILPR
jgi:hypothetical protein